MNKELLVRQIEYVYPDSYAYVVRDKQGKFIVSGWSEEEAEARLMVLLDKQIIEVDRWGKLATPNKKDKLREVLE